VACETVPQQSMFLPEGPFTTLVVEPERPLPVLGRINATYDGQRVLWPTLDFSVGAIDPSANVGTFDGVTTLFIGGYLPGQDFNEDVGRIRIEADLA
jgi:hypothetical protein